LLVTGRGGRLWRLASWACCARCSAVLVAGSAENGGLRNKMRLKKKANTTRSKRSRVPSIFQTIARCAPRVRAAPKMSTLAIWHDPQPLQVITGRANNTPSQLAQQSKHAKRPSRVLSNRPTSNGNSNAQSQKNIRPQKSKFDTDEKTNKTLSHLAQQSKHAKRPSRVLSARPTSNGNSNAQAQKNIRPQKRKFDTDEKTNKTHWSDDEVQFSCAVLAQ